MNDESVIYAGNSRLPEPTPAIVKFIEAHTLKETAECVGCSYEGIRRYCKTHGITPMKGKRGPKKRSKWSERMKRVTVILAMCDSGMTYEQIGTTLGVTRQAVQQYVKQYAPTYVKQWGKYTFGGYTLTIHEWAKKVGMSYSTLCRRIYERKWTTKRALTTPVGKAGRKDRQC